MKWQEELLWELGVLSRYGGHQEVNRLLIERRDARMQEKGQTGPEWACMKWRDAQSLRLQFQEEGRHEGVCGGRKVLVKVHHQTTT
ncbi:hypothetical protein EJ03DRAFT_133236 [Teratosphaeria nubilosa]|uniref:Uncharacterized protein n=1 Tax=Teratosphaeria nubilosa TaxID=161662 RepID=A0A6G1L5C6_9PEZI|nr:hypothetical protein EJ03DRAFT_133236 [Teratosphaeria nubilosa]